MHYIDAISWYDSICVFLSQNVRVFFLFFSFFTLLLLFSWLRFLRTNTIITDNNTNRWQSKKKQLTALFFSSKLFCLLSFCWLNPKKKNISTNDLRVQHIAQCVCVCVCTWTGRSVFNADDDAVCIRRRFSTAECIAPDFDFTSYSSFFSLYYQICYNAPYILFNALVYVCVVSVGWFNSKRQIKMCARIGGVAGA